MGSTGRVGERNPYSTSGENSVRELLGRASDEELRNLQLINANNPQMLMQITEEMGRRGN